MIRSSIRVTTLVLACLIFVGGVSAQIKDEQLTREIMELKRTLARVQESAVYQNGKLSSLVVRLPNGTERLVNIEQGADDKSLTIIDQGKRIAVSINFRN